MSPPLPSAPLRPTTVEEAQALLSGAQGTIAFAGGRTAGGAAPAETVLQTTGLDRILAYAPSDQVVTVEAGLTLSRLQQRLAEHGQRLALDVPLPERATLGGIVAANSFGPLRTRFGSVRDLIIGVSIVRADGTQAKGGGKVVKTVAGFDLPKLMCGSRGTLGLIATVTFRVHPLPEHTCTVAARNLGAPAVVELMKRLRALQLEPAAMLATRTSQGFDVAVRFEGFKAGVVQQRQKLPELDDAPDALFAEHLSSRGAARLGALPTHLPQVDAAVPRELPFSWYPMLGLGFTDPKAIAVARPALAALGGWMVADGDWGPAPTASPLHRAVKARLDPRGIIAPGSFVGGI